MIKGVVKWFDSAKGYGFITTAGTQEDVFLHYSDISVDGYKTVEQNQEVEFEMFTNERNKLQARNVVAI